MGWKLTYGGLELREADVTGAQVQAVGQLVGRTDWTVVNPLNGPDILIGWLALMVSANTKRPIEEVIVFMASQRVADLLSYVSQEADETPTPHKPPRHETAGV